MLASSTGSSSSSPLEGTYIRVLNARQNAPHESYVVYFMDLLAKTVRDEIAGCSEKGYDYLSISDAKKMFSFSSDKELQQYIAEEHPEWDVKDGRVLFQRRRSPSPARRYRRRRSSTRVPDPRLREGIGKDCVICLFVFLSLD
uniref:CSN8/PSMD8/EIF3K domain-containing protein n=1 Tax=Triticum urartu TaxID=4572 RepID=A0A8R7PM37_TRIUA